MLVGELYDLVQRTHAGFRDLGDRFSEAATENELHYFGELELKGRSC